MRHVRPTRTRVVTTATAVLLALGLTGATVASAQPCSPGRNHLVVTAGATGFRVAGHLDGGLATIRFTNDTDVVHVFDLYRLVPGATLETFLAAARAGDFEALQAMMADGGPGNGNPALVSPHQTAVATGDGLRPGTYVAVDGLPGADGVPNYLEGFATTITVGAGANPDRAPVDEGEVVIDDQAVHLPAAILDGHGTFAVRYAGARPHEFQLLRLHGDATVAQAWAYWSARFNGENPPGDPPADFVGGLADLRPGVHGWVTIDLPPGRYGVWSVTDGDFTDIYAGVVTTFTVQPGTAR